MADGGPTPQAGTPAEAPAGADTLHAALEAARAQGLPAAEPMRWRRIDALAQRMAGHEGATRKWLEARLQTLLGDGATRAAPIAPVSAPVPAPVAVPAAPGHMPTSPLGALLAQLQATAGPSTADATAPATQTRVAANAAPELKTVRQHRAAWSQLRAEQRVAEAHTALPDQAGPLNSQRLLHRALTLMRETSPGYLQHFTAQADALMWLERALAAPTVATAPVPRARSQSAKPSSARGAARSNGPKAGKSARG